MKTPLRQAAKPLHRFARGTPVENRHGRKLSDQLTGARASRRDGFGRLIARPPRFHGNSGGARFLFERQPDGVLDREVLRCCQPFGKSFGFLR